MGLLMIIWAVLATLTAVGGNFDPYMDNLLFSINWPGPGPGAGGAQKPTGTAAVSLESLTDDNSVVVMTQDNERYKCILPATTSSATQDAGVAYNGPSEMELLKPLLNQATCSYRIESYWTYEMCHGKFLRQYHEEKEGTKKPKLQEYFLGYYKEAEHQFKDKQHVDSASTQAQEPDSVAPTQKTEEQDAPLHRKKPPVHKVDGYDMPYFEMEFSGGTKCDLTGSPRRASLRYVCIPEGRGEVYELKESSTCEYEVVILTSLLCPHPDYKPKTDPVNHIQCHPVDGSPARPRNLESLEKENNAGRYNSKEFWDFELGEFLRLNEQKQAPEEPVHKEPDQDTAKQHERKLGQQPSVPAGAGKALLLKDFLSGDSCLQGGHGWWKEEFCFGKYALQYHEERGTRQTQIILGTWNKEAHIAWLRENPHKKPKAKEIRRAVSHFYGSGAICDITGKPRKVEVKLKCKNNSDHPHAVIIYLQEPKTCEYVLVVESALLCSVISECDENGLFTTV